MDRGRQTIQDSRLLFDNPSADGTDTSGLYASGPNGCGRWRSARDQARYSVGVNLDLRHLSVARYEAAPAPAMP